jgi:hypothetical protein
MHKTRCSFGAILSILALAGSATRAQPAPEPPTPTPPTTTPEARPTSGDDRLFLGFAEEATVVDRQWWEGQIERREADQVDLTLVQGIVAFQPWKGVEIGGRMGFGSSDTSGGLPDGSGGTDVDAWAKLYMGERFEDTEFAAGGIVTVPTGDDTAGLGTDAFGLAVFGSVRHRLTRMILSGNLGARMNGDGDYLGQDLEGDTSLFLGGGVIVPISDQVTLVAEGRIESERFEGMDEDARILGGINWRALRRGMIRGAVAAGLADGAPDAQLLVGYAVRF